MIDLQNLISLFDQGTIYFPPPPSVICNAQKCMSMTIPLDYGQSHKSLPNRAVDKKAMYTFKAHNAKTELSIDQKYKSSLFIVCNIATMHFGILQTAFGTHCWNDQCLWCYVLKIMCRRIFANYFGSCWPPLFAYLQQQISAISIITS